MYDRSLQLYKAICAFELFTGGGDADSDGEIDADDEDERLHHYTKRLEGARSTGKAVGKLTMSDIDKWYNKGWYTLFNDW
jgi:hypothetical protein